MFRRILLPVLLTALLVPFARAQTDKPSDTGGDSKAAPADRGGNRQDRGGRNFDPSQMREQFLSSIKEQMSATDDEWKVITPKLEKVMDAQRDSRGGGFGMMRRGRDRGGDSNNSSSSSSDQQRSAVSQASHDLRTVLDNKSASADEISAKLTALRQAKEKAKADLQVAQKDLKEVLTQRQEATLVMMGMLD